MDRNWLSKANRRPESPPFWTSWYSLTEVMKSLPPPPTGRNVWYCWLRGCTPRNVGWIMNWETYGPWTLPSPTTTCPRNRFRSEEHTSELQSLTNLVCRLLLEKKKTKTNKYKDKE